MEKNPAAKDSCVVLYWPLTKMQPDEHRELGFTYGLGRADSDLALGDPVKANAKMRLFVTQASSKKPIVATAYVKASDPKQTVNLKLPARLSLAVGQNAQQTVPPANSAGYSQVTWKLTAAKPGTYVLEAEGVTLGIAAERVVVRDASMFE